MEARQQTPLTKEGEEKMLDVARGMKKLEIEFDILLTSPYVRARRTAEIVAQGLPRPTTFLEALTSPPTPIPAP